MSSQALLDQLVALQTEVAANTSATQSAETLINGFAAQLTAAVATASDDTGQKTSCTLEIGSSSSTKAMKLPAL